MEWKIGLFLGVTLLGAGEALPAGEGGVFVQWTALGILAMAVVKLFAELAAQRKDRKEERKANQEVIDTICARQNENEKTRHEDHEKLVSTLTDLRLHCAKKLNADQ
jgi:hypothetical protein